MALDGLQIVHSRTAVLEIFLSVFVLGAVLCFLHHLDHQEPGSVTLGGWAIASGVLVGLAIATKWVAAPFAVGMAVVTVIAAAPNDRRAALRLSGTAFVVIPVLVYVASYAVSWTSGDVT
ncbi:MAG: phospholipid carrier-dependent glycosyltransferase, partial [Actinomycetota bacterium]